MSTCEYFKRPKIALAPRACAILLVFEKIYCLFIPNRTRNHVISYANDQIFMVLKAFD